MGNLARHDKKNCAAVASAFAREFRRAPRASTQRDKRSRLAAFKKNARKLFKRTKEFLKSASANDGPLEYYVLNQTDEPLRIFVQMDRDPQRRHPGLVGLAIKSVSQLAAIVNKVRGAVTGSPSVN